MVAMLKARRKDADRGTACAPVTSGPDTGLVFTTELGTVDPRNLLRTVAERPRPGIEKSAPTLCAIAGRLPLEDRLHIKAAADLLGHASISITGDLYGHTTDDTARSRRRGGLAGSVLVELVGVQTWRTDREKAAPEPRKWPLTCVGLTGFEPATT